MKNKKRKTFLTLLLIFPLFAALGYSDKDKEIPEEPVSSIFEAVINFPDKNDQLAFKATKDKLKIFVGDVNIDENTIPNAFVLQAEDNDSAQVITLFATQVTKKGTYTMGENEFEVAPLFSSYKKDKDNAEIKDNLYTFHAQTIDMGDKMYNTEVTLIITALTEERIKGRLEIVMYSSILEYEGTGDNKKLIDGFAHKGVLSAEFDSALTTL